MKQKKCTFRVLDIDREFSKRVDVSRRRVWLAQTIITKGAKPRATLNIKGDSTHHRRRRTSCNTGQIPDKRQPTLRFVSRRASGLINPRAPIEDSSVRFRHGGRTACSFIPRPQPPLPSLTSCSKAVLACANCKHTQHH